MNNSITLRGLALSKYKNISAFAEAIGWQRNKASRILNALQEPNPKEIAELVKVLDINSQKMFFDIFFASLSEIWTKQTV